jgi:hypothetical protein
VRDLFGSSNARGDHSLAWDGRANSGRALPGGVYFLNLEVGGQRMTRKLLLSPVNP